MLSDTAAISVPVFGPDDQIVGAMMAAAPLDRMRTNFDTLLATLITAGQEASG
jgi:DNA-binding IclR family transcriptional regulator